MNSIIIKDSQNNNKYCINHINEINIKRLHADPQFATTFFLEQLNKGLKPLRSEKKQCTENENQENIKTKQEYLDIIGKQEEFETFFLILIFERRPLFDYTLPINQRSADIVDKLWEEVSNELSAYGTFDKMELISYWRLLRDSYTRYKNSLKYASSNPSAILPLPKYADILTQFDNVIDKKKAVISTAANTQVYTSKSIRCEKNDWIKTNASRQNDTSDPKSFTEQVKIKSLKTDVLFVDTHLISGQDESKIMNAELYSGDKIPSNNIKYKNKYKYAEVNGNHDEFEIYFLNLIFERPPLFDYTLPIVQRSPHIINELWEEISCELSEYGTFDKSNLIFFWRRLRDSYTRYNNSLQKARSNTSTILPIPKHADILKKLDEIIKKRRQMRRTNIEAWDETSTSDSNNLPQGVKNELTPEVFFVSVEEEKVAESSACEINDKLNSNNNKFKKKGKYSNVIGTEEEFEVALLNLIFERPPLFDYKLPANQRSVRTINILWEEVSVELSQYGTFNKSQLINFWRCLRDSYTRFKNSINKVYHSGSSLTTSCVRPKHFDLLKQLDNVIHKRNISTFTGRPRDISSTITSSAQKTDELCSNPSAILPLPKHADLLKRLDNVIDKIRPTLSTETDTSTDIYSSNNHFSIPIISKSSITIHSCRTCLKNDGALSLFEQYNNQLIVDMISDLINVKNVAEGFLKNICKSCVEKLYAAFVFKQECENSEKIMQHFVFEDTSKEEQKNICENEFTETDSYSELDHDTDGMNMNAKVSLQIELVDISEEDKLSENYECDLCFQSFENEQNLAIHRAIIHKEDKQFKCEYCDKTFHLNVSLQRHRKTHSKSIEQEKIDSIDNDLKEHDELHEAKEYKCDICCKQITNFRNFKSHIRRHENPEFICEYCSKQFWNKYDLLQHQKLIHLKEKPHKCATCNRGFFYKQKLKIHQFIHTGEKPFKCKYCGRAFSDRSGLIVHTKLHTGDKRHQCEICLRLFSFPSQLVIHKREHTGEKPFQCQYCNLGFNRNSALTMHLRIHTGIKPFKCHICEKAFRLREGLKRHVRIHTGEKPFECMFCDNKYGNAGNLRTHSKHYCKNNPNRIKKVIQNL